MYNLKIKNGHDDVINFTDWQKETVDTLNEHKNIKKVWLVSHQRLTGATYFAKLLMYFRPPCTGTFVISNHLHWSKIISKGLPRFDIKILMPHISKDGEYYKASNFLTPVTLLGLEKEVIGHWSSMNDDFHGSSMNKKEELYYKEYKRDGELFNSFGEYLSSLSCPLSYECLYDRDFDVKTYNELCSYNFNFFIINVSQKDLEKTKPFIEADKDKEDVLIVNIENTMFPEILNEFMPDRR